ncbi:MAG: DUF721 domain-containing protein [Selenomonas sp.]|nr:DUF721 domain-containing protein [Selenomonas sp.]
MQKKHDTRRTPWLEKPDSIIPRWVKSKGQVFEMEYRRRWVLAYWRDIVGDTISRNVELMGIRKKTLLYYCSSPAWNNEMRLLMPQIVDKMNRFAGCEVIREVRATTRWEKPEAGDVLSFRAWLRQEEEKIPDFRKEREKTLLSREEEQGAKELETSSEDSELGNLLGRIYRKNLQLRKVQANHGWLPCADCGSLTEPQKGGETVCPACRSRRAEKRREAIRQVLRDMPWARTKEVAEFVPEVTPKEVSEQRAMMVQQLAAEVDVEDRKSLKAMQLVMLFKVLPPEQLTEDNVERAMYALRFSLNRPKDYVMPKRYSKIKLGKEEKGSECLHQQKLRYHHVPALRLRPLCTNQRYHRNL